MILLAQKKNLITSKLLVSLISINLHFLKTSKKVNKMGKFFHKILEIFLKKGYLIMLKNLKVKASFLLEYSVLANFLILFVLSKANIYFVCKSKKKLIIFFSKYLIQRHYKFLKINKFVPHGSTNFNSFFISSHIKNYRGIQRIRKNMMKKQDLYNYFFFTIF
mmetsp:Transcript_27883/g.38930  ORF Transcript_27883/g.38930 Transcript_27883/m.38930 type:complete len:163 (-) Transcript_27883:826-1314(-)